MLERMGPQYSTMIPTLLPKPFHREGWVYEEKVDGWRILAYKDGARVYLVSRNGVNHTRRFVAKDKASAYEGGRTKQWLKVKVPGAGQSGRIVGGGAPRWALAARGSFG